MKKKKKKKKKFIILVIGEWRSRASSSHLTIMTNFICNRSYMTLEQINIYTNISKISLSMADSVMVFTRQCDHVYHVKHTKSSLLFKA